MLSRAPSLSPCLEDSSREARFLFHTPSHSTSSSCSPFLHNKNFSKLCTKDFSTGDCCSNVGANLLLQYEPPQKNNLEPINDFSELHSERVRKPSEELKNFPSILVEKATPGKVALYNANVIIKCFSYMKFHTFKFHTSFLVCLLSITLILISA